MILGTIQMHITPNNKNNYILKKILQLPIKVSGPSRITFELVTNYDPITKSMNNILQKKLDLYFKLNYGIQISMQNISSIDTTNPKISQYIDKYIDISGSNFFLVIFDELQEYLYEGLQDIIQNRIIDGFPKLVTWTDKYIKKGSSKFCIIRNALIHPNLYKESKKELEHQYPNELEFNSDDSLKRYSQKNITFVESKIPELMSQIKIKFNEIYFKNELRLSQRIKKINNS